MDVFFTMKLWDMRRPDKMEKQLTAHSGPVFTIDWHPDDKNWLGTAGRDKMIKVSTILDWIWQVEYMLVNILSNIECFFGTKTKDLWHEWVSYKEQVLARVPRSWSDLGLLWNLGWF